MENKDEETLDIAIQIGKKDYKISIHVEFDDKSSDHKVTIKAGMESDTGTTPFSTVYSGPMTFIQVIVKSIVENVMESEIRNLMSPLRRKRKEDAQK